MKIIHSPIEGLKIVESAPNRDERGSFTRWYCEKSLSDLLGNKHIVQINHSKTVKAGSIRGMHFQKAPHADTKFVRCIKGRVFDVAVDLRKDSPTFLTWATMELTPENNLMFAIPEGCAHGFQILENDSELLYLHTAFYEPSSEGGVNFADPKLEIEWPLPPTDISDRDRNYPMLDNNFKGF